MRVEREADVVIAVVITRDLRPPVTSARSLSCLCPTNAGRVYGDQAQAADGDDRLQARERFAETRQCACGAAPPARRSHSRRAIVPTAASRRCLCHGRERQRRPTLTIASTIHATRTGRSPPTDRARRGPRLVGAARAASRALASRALRNWGPLASADVPIRLMPM